jgi:single-strand DNA-binding protein
MAINNFISIIGNVGRNPEAKSTTKINETGEAHEMMTFTVCINERYKKNGQWIKKPFWVNCVCYLPAKVTYLKKFLCEGDLINVQGKLSSYTYESNKYVDKSNNPAQIEKFTLIVDDFILLNNGKNNNNETKNVDESNALIGEPF